MVKAEDFNRLKLELLDKYFGFLNPHQREAVYTTQGPLLVLAGAGSGKTTVIVNRIANIILFGKAATDQSLPDNAEDLIPIMENALKKDKVEDIKWALRRCAVEPAFAYRVLCITFTNKAAKEFKERLQGALGDQANDIWAGTFHSICVRILRRYIDRLGYNNDFTIYDTDDSKKLISEILKELKIPESMISPREALNFISKAKENSRTASDEAMDAGRDQRRIKLAKVYSKYQKSLKSANALDFDDIIMLTNRLFDENFDILEKYQDQFEYILVDEYQDTNPSQSDLVAKLAGKKKNVCVVGDDDQSIYSFRGATVDNILGFDLEYRNAKVIRLEQNYRSTGNILSAANGIIKNNRDRKGKELWTDAGEGEKVHIKRLFTQLEEGNFICDTIKEKVSMGAKYSDFAVLYRVNALSNSLETAFVKKKIPYKIFGGIRFYERREVKDILAYLSIIANPSDNVRLRRILNVPKRSIGDATIEKITEIAALENISMFEVIANAGNYPSLLRVYPKLERFGALIKDLKDYSKENTVSNLVSKVIEETGYRLMLQEEHDGKEREENILELVSSAALFEEGTETPTLSGFLNELALVSDLDSYGENTDAVVLMTVHSAKGLEFPTVFIAGFEEGLFPSSQSFAEGDKGLEEERRLAYVAVTRAKKELYLLNTSSRMLYGRTETRQISRFGNEMPPDCCDKATIRDSSGHTAAPVSAYSTRHINSRNNYIDNTRATPKTEKVETFAEGDKIKHQIFGEGVILSALPTGGDMLYEIEFKNGSIKRIMGNFAKLKRV